MLHPEENGSLPSSPGAGLELGWGVWENRQQRQGDLFHLLFAWNSSALQGARQGRERLLLNTESKQCSGNSMLRSTPYKILHLDLRSQIKDSGLLCNRLRGQALDTTNENSTSWRLSYPRA